MLLGFTLRAEDAPPTAPENAAAGKPAGAAKPAAPMFAPLKGRLPPYYSKVVNDAQRQQIYGIQAAYAARKEALEKELGELTSRRDAEIRAVLTPFQQQKLDGLVTAARAKSKKPQQVAPAAPPDDVQAAVEAQGK